MKAGDRVTWMRRIRSGHRVATPAVVERIDGSFALLSVTLNGIATRRLVRVSDVRPAGA